ncbi:hypothetical protein HOE04_05550 [archaeon]|jgi:hypothetical protein|nr:hypothetical protein [archaeon]
MDKRGITNLMGNVVYILLVVVFIGVIAVAIARVGSNSTLYEQIYAKQIALLIDKGDVGMEIEMDVYELYSFAKKKRFKGKIVDINKESSEVVVRLVDGKGYSYGYFNDVKFAWDLKDDDKKLILRFVENG